jgi:hypothetical protein
MALAAKKVKTYIGSLTEYSSAPIHDDIEMESNSTSSSSTTETQNETNSSSTRRLWKTITIQAFSLSWIIPIAYLLVLNERHYVIGASAWCPGSHCWVDPYNEETGVAQENISRFEHNGRNLLGVLQLVAKSLELWFAFIAASLIYLMVMFLASAPSALPLRLVHLPNEFTEPATLFDRSLWSSLTSTRYIVLFVTASSLGILCNLMGPATAILAIPTLQWIDTPHTDFEKLVATSID